MQNLNYFEPDNKANAFTESMDNIIVYHNIFSFITQIKVKVLNVTEELFIFISVVFQLD